MNKLFNYLFFTFILTFIFIFNVNAECSYKERKELLDMAKNVDISYEAIKSDNGIYHFKFNVVGLTEDLFIEYYNTNNGVKNHIFYSDLENGVYSFVDENSFLTYSYEFKMYTTKDNCMGKEYYSKKIKKPIYNIYSENSICSEEGLENFKYCKKFLDKDYNLTNNRFLELVSKYLEEKNVNQVVDKENETFVKKNLIWIIPISVILLAGIVIMVIRIKKKQSEL